ncbi:MAG: cytidylate kinase-like family protein [Eubacterium sp.]|nr:cytidylate kinase-like family protein [Eubacterium sp.]
MNKQLLCPVITIGREYCAYGRTIAAALSERLGIPYYDKDFVDKTVIESGFSAEDVLAESETMSGLSKFLDAMLNPTASYTSSFDRIFEAQKDVVLDLAKNPCILVGRCANDILIKENIKCYNIFLYADLDFRMKRGQELHPDMDDEHLEKYIKKLDHLRATYYKKYTGKDIRYFENYDICLDVGAIGVDKSIDVLESIICI